MTYAKNAVNGAADRRYHDAAVTIILQGAASHPATGEWIVADPNGDRISLTVNGYGTPVLVKYDHRSIVRALHVLDVSEVL